MLAVKVAASLAGMALVAYGFARLWRYLGSRQWVPAGAHDAVRVACDALGIQRPLVYWIRGRWFHDVWGRNDDGMWVPSRLTIAKGDDQAYSDTALAFELSREARQQLEGVRDESEPTKDGAMPPSLVHGYEVARAALKKAGM